MKFLVFDVESAGLNGGGFAVGYVIVDDVTGCTVESDWRSAGIGSVECTDDNRTWLINNLPTEVLFPEGEHKLSLSELREWFRGIVGTHQGCAPCADCSVPVEAKFLAACQLNPYPLHEIATVLLLAGRDPVGTFERLPYELPAHHPMHDSRQSGRILLECLAQIRRVEYPPMAIT